MSKAYIGLGSNLENPLEQVRLAVQTIQQHPELSLLQQSSWYRSVAIGPAGQPDYINGAIAIETGLNPLALLDILQSIENEHGRVRALRWGARTLDLDILLFNDEVILSDRLTIPHAEIENRNFVLQPLLDLDSNLQLPNGEKVCELLAKLGVDGLEKIRKVE